MLNRCSCWGLLEAILKKKSKTVAHCGKTRHHREPAIKHTQKKKSLQLYIHTNRGPQYEEKKQVIWAMDSVLKGQGPLEWQLLTKLLSFGRSWKKKKKRIIWKSPNFDLIPPPMMVQDGEEWSCGSTLLSKTKRIEWKKNGTACIFILAVFYSCCSYYH